MNTTATTLRTPMLVAHDIRESYGKGTARFDALAGVALSVPARETARCDRQLFIRDGRAMRSLDTPGEAS